MKPGNVFFARMNELGAIEIPRVLRKHFTLGGTVKLIITDDGILIQYKKKKPKGECVRFDGPPLLTSMRLY